MTKKQIQFVGGLVAALALPPAIVLFTSVWFFSDLVVPEVVTTLVRSDASIGVISDLAKLMISMSIGVALASTWFYRQPHSQNVKTISHVGFLVAMAVALVSIYAGMRFLFDMAVQLQQTPFNLELLRGRLAVEGSTLLIQLSLLCAGAVLHHFHRDRRYRMTGGE
jgi:hypothetical protein